MSKKYKNESELLKLINTRAAWNLPPHRKPRYNAAERELVNNAARAYGDANRADPFAAARMKHYMLQGYELPSEVLADARGRIKAS